MENLGRKFGNAGYVRFATTRVNNATVATETVTVASTNSRLINREETENVRTKTRTNQTNSKIKWHQVVNGSAGLGALQTKRFERRKSICATFNINECPRSW